MLRYLVFLDFIFSFKNDDDNNAFDFISRDDFIFKIKLRADINFKLIKNFNYENYMKIMKNLLWNLSFLNIVHRNYFTISKKK